MVAGMGVVEKLWFGSIKFTQILLGCLVDISASIQLFQNKGSNTESHEWIIIWIPKNKHMNTRKGSISMCICMIYTVW